MKRFITKRNNKHKLILIFFIIIFILFIYFSLKKLNNSYNNYINFLLSSFSDNNKKIMISKNFNYLLSNYTFKEETTTKIKDYYTVYLYNTYDNEKYSDNTSIIETSNMLSNNLNKLGIKSIIEDKKVSDYLNFSKKEYDISREFLKENMNNNHFDLSIDIQRDSLSDTSVTINNKQYAKILFVLGLDNPNYLENKEILIKMNDYLNTNYPGLSKGILEKQDDKVNNIYNQDLGKNVILTLIGGVENDYEEVNNSTEIMALMIYNFLGDQK